MGTNLKFITMKNIMEIRPMCITEKLQAIIDNKPNVIISSDEAQKLLNMIHDMEVNADILPKTDEHEKGV